MASRRHIILAVLAIFGMIIGVGSIVRGLNGKPYDKEINFLYISLGIFCLFGGLTGVVVVARKTNR